MKTFTAQFKINIVNRIINAKGSSSSEVRVMAKTALLKLSLGDIKAIWAVLSLRAAESDQFNKGLSDAARETVELNS